MSEEIQNITNISEANCYRYLLGQMTEEEMFEFDDLCFGDENCIEELEAIREEIIDRYLKFDLTQEQNKAFENYFLASPFHQEKLEFSQRLMETVPEKQSWLTAWANSMLHYFKGIPNFFSNKLGTVGLATAAILISFGILGLLIFQQNNSKSPIASNPNNQSNKIQNQNEPINLTANNSNLTQNAIPLNNRGVTLPNNLTEKEKMSPQDNKNTSDNKQSNLEIRKKESENNQPKTESQPILGASFIFTPLLGGGSKSAEGKEALLIINRKTPDLIPFKIFAPEDSSVNYLVIIKTEGKEVWRSQTLKTKKNAKNLILSVPKKVLSSGDYTLGIFELNDLEYSVEAYSFRVKKQD
jgi:hypothetical protein